MRTESHIDEFGKAVDQALDELRLRLPEDLIFTRNSDQPKQVEDNVELFMNSLYEAVILVVLTALIGFWEWRQALLIALSIPATLTMTFGMMSLLGIDLQQVSIASLIISLGLLVDDPVVAGDAIKTSMEQGHPRKIAAWLGPTKLAHAIMLCHFDKHCRVLAFAFIAGHNRSIHIRLARRHHLFFDRLQNSNDDFRADARLLHTAPAQRKYRRFTVCKNSERTLLRISQLAFGSSPPSLCSCSCGFWWWALSVWAKSRRNFSLQIKSICVGSMSGFLKMHRF